MHYEKRANKAGQRRKPFVLCTSISKQVFIIGTEETGKDGKGPYMGILYCGPSLCGNGLPERPERLPRLYHFAESAKQKCLGVAF